MVESGRKGYRAGSSFADKDVGRYNCRHSDACKLTDYVVSRYNHMFDLNNRNDTVLFNAASGALVVVSDFIGTALTQGDISNLPQDVIHELVRGEFLIPSDVDELLRVYYDTMVLWHDRSVAYVVVAPTMQCNFECSYCFEKGVDRSQTMDEGTVRSTISFIKNLAAGARYVGLGWFGGEPLLALETILTMTDAVRTWAVNNHIGFCSSITTNGYLLTPTVVDQLTAVGVTAANITLDGPAEVHDARRRPKTGARSFYVILNNLMYAKTKMCITIRMNIDQTNRAFTSILYEGLIERNVISNGAESFYIARVDGSSGYPSCLGNLDFLKFVASWHSEYKGAAGLNVQIPTPSIACIARRPRAFAIDPKGHLHKCVETIGREEEAVGSIYKENFHLSEKFQQWTALDPFAIERCRSCTLLPSCRGGCPHKWVKAGVPDCLCDLTVLGDLLATFNDHYEALSVTGTETESLYNGGRECFKPLPR